MSSPAAGGAGGSGDKPPGLSRFMRRASKVLRRGSSKRGSISGLEEDPSGEGSSPPAAIPEQPTSGAIETPKTQAPKTATTAPTVPAAISQSIKDLRTANPRLSKTAAESSAIQEEKARALFAKYGLTLSPGEWTRPVKGDAERVEKKVRLRIHRTCHRCQTTFGADKVCSNCQHKSCKKCPRYPAKRDKAAKDKEKPIAVDPNPSKEQALLTIRARRAGLDLNLKENKQRVRRTCHRCSELFVKGTPECPNCGHERCIKCPRDPPKLDKYPRGYPGDKEETFPLALRERKKPRLRIRWKCHTCAEIFLVHSKTCAQCGHSRCDDCPRDPPKRLKPQPSEEVLRSVAEKMRAMTISPTASAAA